MKRKILDFFLFAALVLTCLFLLPAEVEADSESDLTFKLNEDGNSYSVYECSSSASGDLIIPATYEGKPVIGIGKNAFSFCSNLTSVTIPNSVTEIGDDAFSYCDSLTFVTIPNSVTRIRPGVFFDCESLTSVTIPDSVTKIDEYAFYSCKNLKNVYYGGDETQFAEIEIERSNHYFINAEIVYNYTTPGSPSVLIVIIIAAVLASAATAAVIIIRKKNDTGDGNTGDGSVC